MGHRHLLNTSLQLFEMDHNHYQSGGTAGQSHVHIGKRNRIWEK